MDYALIDRDNNRVKQIIENDGMFKDVPLENRFPLEIVKNCIAINSNDIKEGMDYNWETGEFSEHVDLFDTNVEEEEENDDEEDGTDQY